MKKTFCITVAVLIGLLGACEKIGNGSNNGNGFRYSGTIETTKVTLSSKVASDILKFSLEEGDEVKAGDVVVQINDDKFRIAAKQLDNSYGRSCKLKKDGYIPDEQHDVTVMHKDTNDLYIKWCRIEAPISGTIVTKFKEEGEYVSPGMNILSIANLKDVWAYFYVEHGMVHKLKVGDCIKCYLPELPKKTIIGKIIKINEEAEFTPKNVQTREERTRLVYGVKVRFANDDMLLKSGMVLETAFEQEKKK